MTKKHPQCCQDDDNIYDDEDEDVICPSCGEHACPVKCRVCGEEVFASNCCP